MTGTYSLVRNNEVLIKNIIGALYILSFTMVIARITAGLLQIRGERHDHELASTSILGNIVRAIVYCIGLILILQTFGVAIAPLLTALGVGGIAVALALQPTLSNLFSGLQLDIGVAAALDRERDLREPGGGTVAQRTPMLALGRDLHVEPMRIVVARSPVTMTAARGDEQDNSQAAHVRRSYDCAARASALRTGIASFERDRHERLDRRHGADS